MNMFKRAVATCLTCLLTFTLLLQQSAFASVPSEKDAAHAQKIKAGIMRLGAGKATRVSLSLRDKTKLTGYISEISEDSFVVADLEKDRLTTVAYPDVVQVKGNNLSTRTKVIIGVAIAVGVAITLYIVRGAFCDGC
jgi:hypothetical protein